MNKFLLALAIAAPMAATPALATAKGCLKGAAIGGVAGHVAGHHGLVGAAAGCAIGHHREKVKARADRQGAAQGNAPATTPVGDRKTPIERRSLHSNWASKNGREVLVNLRGCE